VRIARLLPVRVRRLLAGLLGHGPWPPVGWVRMGGLRRTSPVSRRFGYDRGLPVDRHYIEAFLARASPEIRGRVLEIGDAAYTERFGGTRVTRSDVLDVRADAPGATIVGDLQDAPQIPSDAFDCVILTQTLQLVFDLPATLRTVHRILRPGGVLLVTVPGITSTGDPQWRETWYWSFTARSVERLLGEVFGPGRVEVEAFGNVLTSTAFLHGLAAEELTAGEFATFDPDYATLVTAVARKA